MCHAGFGVKFQGPVATQLGHLLYRFVCRINDRFADEWVKPIVSRLKQPSFCWRNQAGFQVSGKRHFRTFPTQSRIRSKLGGVHDPGPDKMSEHPWHYKFVGAAGESGRWRAVVYPGGERRPATEPGVASAKAFTC